MLLYASVCNGHSSYIQIAMAFLCSYVFSSNLSQKMQYLVIIKRTSVAMNKMDTAGSDPEYDQFLGLYKSKLSKLIKVHSIVPISCYTGQGLDQLQDLLYELKYKNKRKITEADVV